MTLAQLIAPILAAAATAPQPGTAPATARLYAPAPMHLAYAHPAGWRQGRGEMEATPAVGLYERRVPLGAGATCTVGLRVMGLVGGRRPARGRHRVAAGGVAWTQRLASPPAVVDLWAFAEVDRFGPAGPDGYPALSPTRSQRRACAMLERVLGARAAAVARRTLRVAAGPPM